METNKTLMLKKNKEALEVISAQDLVVLDGFITAKKEEACIKEKVKLHKEAMINYMSQNEVTKIIGKDNSFSVTMKQPVSMRKINYVKVVKDIELEFGIPPAKLEKIINKHTKITEAKQTIMAKINVPKQ